jgi:hypothetical protein
MQFSLFGSVIALSILVASVAPAQDATSAATSKPARYRSSFTRVRR